MKKILIIAIVAILTAISAGEILATEINIKFITVHPHIVHLSNQNHNIVNYIGDLRETIYNTKLVGKKCKKSFIKGYSKIMKMTAYIYREERHNCLRAELYITWNVDGGGVRSGEYAVWLHKEHTKYKDVDQVSVTGDGTFEDPLLIDWDRNWSNDMTFRQLFG